MQGRNIFGISLHDLAKTFFFTTVVFIAAFIRNCKLRNLFVIVKSVSPESLQIIERV